MLLPFEMLQVALKVVDALCERELVVAGSIVYRPVQQNGELYDLGPKVL